MIHLFDGVVRKQYLLLNSLTPSAVVLLRLRRLVRVDEVVGDCDANSVALGRRQADALANLDNELILLEALCQIVLLQRYYRLFQVEYALLRGLGVMHGHVHQDASFPERRLVGIIVHISFDRTVDQA